MLRSLQLLFLSLSFVEALDIILKDFECNETLPVAIQGDNLFLECNGSNQCTMGTDANISGKLLFNGVEDLGLEEEYAFVSAELSFLSIKFDLLQYLQVPMCGRYVGPEGYDFEAANEAAAENDDANNNNNNNQDNGCPADGVYDFHVPYFLPDEESRAAWLATGFNGKGEISFYSQANNVDSLMGSCHLYFATTNSPIEENSPLPGKIPIPSALVTAGALAAFLGLLLLSCMYRMGRDAANGKKKNAKKRLDEESCAATAGASTTDFVTMKE